VSDEDQDKAGLAVWHRRDRRRKAQDKTLCGIDWPGDPVGVVVPCDGCERELLRRRQADRGHTPVV
jgi:hypothetical protein